MEWRILNMISLEMLTNKETLLVDSEPCDTSVYADRSLKRFFTFKPESTHGHALQAGIRGNRSKKGGTWPEEIENANPCHVPTSCAFVGAYPY